MDAAVDVVSSTPVGPPPARRGEVVPPDEVPARFRQMARGDFADDPFRPQLTTLRRVLTAEWEGRTMARYTFVAANGMELVSFGAGTGAARSCRTSRSSSSAAALERPGRAGLGTDGSATGWRP